MQFYKRLRSELKGRQDAGNLRELPLINFQDDNIVVDHSRYIDLSSNDYLGIARDTKFLSSFINTMMDSSGTGSNYATQFMLRTLCSGATGSRLLTGNHLSYAYFEDLVASLFNGCVPSLQGELSGESQSVWGRELASNEMRHRSGCETDDYQALAERECAMGYEAPKEKERTCLYIGSGFDANTGIISTLFTRNDLLLVDRLAHASIIDGMLQSKARSMRFAHNDMKHLEILLEKYHDKYENIVIVTESVFSMDGDRARLREIVALKERYDNVLVYVDEAHSFGLYGDDGLGLCKELNLVDKVDFIMGTLSKAIGSFGAFVLCSREVKDYLVNFMRPLIYATALPPFNVTFSLYVVGLLASDALRYKRNYLREITQYLHNNLKELGLAPSESQIQPLITGDSQKAIEASDIFKRYGLLAMPIRHPTVPASQARLRLTLNCNIRIDDIDRITKVISHHRHYFVDSN